MTTDEDSTGLREAADRLHLDAFPPRDRFDAWRELAAPFFEVSLPAETATPFSGDLASFALGDALLIRSAVSGQRYERDAARIRAGGWDQVAFQLYETGGFVGDYDGREVRVGAGDLNVIDFTRPYRKRSTDETDINLIVPRDAVARHYPGFTHGSVLDAGSGPSLAVATHLAALARIGRMLSEAESGGAVEALLTLVGQGDLAAASATAILYLPSPMIRSGANLPLAASIGPAGGSRMPRYFIDVLNGRDVIDEDGHDLPDLTAARRDAWLALIGMARDVAYSETGLQVRTEIRDADRRLLAAVSLMMMSEKVEGGDSR